MFWTRIRFVTGLVATERRPHHGIEVHWRHASGRVEALGPPIETLQGGEIRDQIRADRRVAGHRLADTVQRAAGQQGRLRLGFSLQPGLGVGYRCLCRELVIQQLVQCAGAIIHDHDAKLTEGVS